MLLEEVQLVTHVIWVLARHIQKKALKVHQLRVMGVILPRCDLNSITRLAAEVFLDIVDDDSLGKITPRTLQVLNVVFGGTRLHILDLQRMLAVKPVGNRPLLIKRVQNFVSVLHTNSLDKIEELAVTDLN